MRRTEMTSLNLGSVQSVRHRPRQAQLCQRSEVLYEIQFQLQSHAHEEFWISVDLGVSVSGVISFVGITASCDQELRLRTKNGVRYRNYGRTKEAYLSTTSECSDVLEKGS